jgi:hypothetical protein
MRLLQVAELFELAERVPHGRRRHTQPGRVCEARGADRFAGVDILRD